MDVDWSGEGEGIHWLAMSFCVSCCRLLRKYLRLGGGKHRRSVFSVRVLEEIFEAWGRFPCEEKQNEN